MKLFPDPLGISVLWRYGLPLAAATIFSTNPAHQIHRAGSLVFACLIFWGLAYATLEAWRIYKNGTRSPSFVTFILMMISIGLATIGYMLLHRMYMFS